MHVFYFILYKVIYSRYMCFIISFLTYGKRSLNVTVFVELQMEQKWFDVKLSKCDKYGNEFKALMLAIGIHEHVLHIWTSMRTAFINRRRRPKKRDNSLCHIWLNDRHKTGAVNQSNKVQRFFSHTLSSAKHSIQFYLMNKWKQEV